MTAPTPAIRVEGLSKRLRHGLMAVDGLDLEVARGSVFALLGPNGSGKTMTMRMLVGLVRPTSGRVFLFGEEVKPGAKVLGRVGALIDGPGFVPHLSGRRNLDIAVRLNRLSGGSADLESAVRMTGLGQAVDRRYSEYSHGMRYRLAVAQATLGSPELLVLDEPTTGIDPAQIQDVRRAIRDVASAGVTVILSSHSMAEIQLLCTHAAVLRSGALLASGSVSELVGSTPEIIVEVDDTGAAVAALSGLVDCRVSTVTPAAVVVAGGSVAMGEVVERLERASIIVHGVRAESLEDAYHVLLESSDGRPLPQPR
jgi:ABC-2 type transport system ATP-binding protein